MQLRKEIKFETLRKNHKKKIIIGVVTLCIVGSVLVFKTTRAKYRFTQSIPFVRGTINYKPYDFKMMAMYQQKDDVTCTEDNCYNEIEIMPESGYKINESKSYCTKDGINRDNNVILKTEDGKHYFSKLSKNEKCYLYFDKKPESVLLAKYTKVGARKNYQTLKTDNSGKVFSLEDDDGMSYYFAGAVTNNWVKFAGFYWRIVRFNGDGSVRLIYSGTTAATTGSGTQIGTSIFSTTYTRNEHVGYRYSSNDVHGYGSPSTIQGVIDTWYKTNIVNKGYGDKVENNAGFCGDRDNYIYNNDGEYTIGGGTGTTETYYGAYIRFVRSAVKASPTPTLKCKNESDLYTITGTKKGNESLTYPVGLITVDEVNAAGTIYNTSNNSYYLYTGQDYWTMSPFRFANGYCSDGYGRAFLFGVSSNGSFNPMTSVNCASTNNAYGVRPVINLKVDTLFASGGDGTSSNPYEVQ